MNLYIINLSFTDLIGEPERMWVDFEGNPVGQAKGVLGGR